MLKKKKTSLTSYELVFSLIFYYSVTIFIIDFIRLAYFQICSCVCIRGYVLPFDIVEIAKIIFFSLTIH